MSRDELVELGCIVCRECLGIHGSPAEIHHLRTGVGMGQRSEDDRAIPLCYRHHRGSEGIHHLGTREWERRYKTEEAFLALVHADHTP